MKRSLIFFLPLISTLFLTFASCRQKYFYTSGETWGTSYHIVYSSGRDLQDSIVAELARIDSIFSIFNAESEICAINANRRTTASADFARVFAHALHAWRASGGAFDPTIAPVAELWGFGVWGGDEVPDSTVLATALATVGMGDCSIDAQRNINKKSPDTRFDFSALAKGYGVDCVAALLKRNGCKNYMVEIGGEVAVEGNNPQDKPWRIQIDGPNSGVAGHNALMVVEMGPAPQAIASSGNYRNYRVDGCGNIYGHTINPATGRPVQTATLAASIIGSTCVEADALATACMVLAPDSATAMLGREGVEGILVVAEADSVRLMTTPGFPR